MSENAFALDESARLREQGEPALDVAVLGARHRFAVQRAHPQLGRARSEHGRQGTRVLVDRVVELVLLEERLGAGENRLGLRAVVGRDAAREETCIDSQPKREPLDRLRGRARLAALDLGDVLLREAVAGEPGLREPGGHTKLAQAFAEARRPGRSGRAHSCGARSHTPAQHAERLTELQSPEGDSPPKGGSLLAFPCQPAVLEIT